MKKTLLYATLTLLGAMALFLVGVVVYESLFEKPPKQKISIEKTTPTTKPKEKTDILSFSIATEIVDYVNSQKYKEKNTTKALLKSSCKVVIKKPKKHKKSFHDNKPRLAIIMDDIASSKHVRAFKKIPFAITPSIFPATARHPNTPRLAKEFKCFMVHMPMEAFHFATPEENTLEVDDSIEVIEEKIAAMHQDFPNAVAINNHTGSKFTSDSEAMDKLFCILDKYDINFIDSKTAPHTKSKEIGKLHNKVVLERDVFLDNEPNVEYILKQLKKAVRYAKKHGEAIAICHPRPETFEALKEAEYLLKDVKMVYIDELL